MAAQRRRLWLAAALLPGHENGAAALPDALAWLDRDPACGQARAAWRDGGSGPDAALLSQGQVPDTGLTAVQRAFPSACDRRVLVLHGATSLAGAGLPGTTLQAALLLSDRGTALGAAISHLHGPRAASRGSRPLAERAAALASGLPNIPLVHMLEPGDEPPWRSLPAGTAWLARSAGALKVLHDDCPTHLNAVGKSLGYLPVGRLDVAAGVPALRPLDAGRAVPDLWASGTEVAVPRRGAPALVLRLVCARIVAADGTVLRQLFGLTSLSASEADAATVARWLVRQEQARRGFRDMAQAWMALPADTDAAALAGRAALAAHLGVACWQLAFAPGAAALDAVLHGALGQGRKLTARAVPGALLKLFSMLEMAA